MPKGDDSYAPYLGWLGQYFLMGLSRKKYRKRQKVDGETKFSRVMQLGEE